MYKKNPLEKIRWQKGVIQINEKKTLKSNQLLEKILKKIY